MNASSQQRSWIILPLGERSFAVPAEAVVELVRSGAVQQLPHTTPHLSGVLVRRGMVLPIWDVAPTLLGADLSAKKFFLVVLQRFPASVEGLAVPVSGECQLVQAELSPASDEPQPYVRGYLALDTGRVPVLDLEALAAFQRATPPQFTPGGAA